MAIDVYNILGARVARITNNKQGAEEQTVVTPWDCGGLAPGVYFARIVITNENGKQVIGAAKKIALIK